MTFEILYRGEKKTLTTLSSHPTAGEILSQLNLSPVYAFVVCDGEVVSEDTPLSPSSTIEVINAISGG
ncbi:MAG: MoaD/ThiS family protein [Brevinematales bacterium]|nr:MoaD/ThiS family protein [Brevinematales bacterium]